MSKKTISFESNIQKLENIAILLEDGSAPLEELITAYEDGMKLAKETREILEKAEQKVIDISKSSEEA